MNIYQLMFKHEKIQKPFGQLSYIVPDIQRTVSDPTVCAIYSAESAYFDKYGTYCLPGTISIAINETDGTQYLIDGQHRMSAYSRLLAEFPERRLDVHIDHYYYTRPECLDVLYKQVNTCQINPITTLSVDHYRILRDVEVYFARTFARYFRPSKYPRRPSLNLPTFIDKLRESRIIDKLNIRVGRQLIDMILDLNLFYSTVPAETFARWKVGDADGIIAKINAESSRLYLGMYANYEWVQRIIDRHTTTPTYNAMLHMCSTYRTRIPAPVRKRVWQTYHAVSMAGECYCCQSPIDFANFECGHVVPVALGGPSSLENLRPICGMCNRDMGTMNLELYRAMLL